MRELVDVVLGRSWQRESPWHGETHWRCVAATGIASTRVAGTDGWLARAASERERPPGWDEVLARLARVA